MLTAPAVCAASGDEAIPVPELDKGFNVDLATALIIIFCSVVAVALLVICIILAKRNMHN